MNSIKRMENLHVKIVNAAKELHELQKKRNENLPKFQSGGVVSKVKKPNYFLYEEEEAVDSKQHRVFAINTFNSIFKD